MDGVLADVADAVRRRKLVQRYFFSFSILFDCEIDREVNVVAVFLEDDFDLCEDFGGAVFAEGLFVFLAEVRPIGFEEGVAG